MNLAERKTITYQRPEIKKGYANQTLHIELGANAITTKPVPDKMRETFVGGKGFDLWLLWEAVQPSTRWDDPANALCISSGPMGGTPAYPGSGKSIVTALSPLTQSVLDSNVGGYFGPYLKFSGFDALAIRGKSAAPTVVFIDGPTQTISLYDAQDLPGDAYALSLELTSYFSGGRQRSISVVSAGPGARNTLMGCLNFSWYDAKRKQVRYKQAGRGGLGTVFEDKGLKALVVRWDNVSLESNQPADKEALRKVAKLHAKEIVALDPKQNEMARIGTTHLVSIMNDFDLLPTNNFRYGQDPRAALIDRGAYEKLFDPGYVGCWMGCTVSCAHGVRTFVPRTGPYKGKKLF
ncbi:MAG: aldehyde ferredoxin oxidoreductase N-terminal domain-containing protein, partial [Desulfosarcinaceae bacterium]